MFRQALREFGYVQGENVVVEDRFADGSEARLREYAAEAVRLRADVVVAVSSAAVRAAADATKTIPIVGLDLESDPVASGFVASLARPAGNLTGFFLDLPEMNGKRLELLKEMIPGIARVALLVDPTLDPAPRRAAEVAARPLGLLLQVHRLPTTSTFSFFTESGVLMSYGPNLNDLFRQAATYVDKILKGARPGELPVQRPTRFELVVNQNTARAIGLAIPPSLRVRADRVIE